MEQNELQRALMAILFDTSMSADETMDGRAGGSIAAV